MYKINKLQHREYSQLYTVQHSEYSQHFNYKWSITFKNCESLCCTPENYTILYINYTSDKKKNQKKKELGLPPSLGSCTYHLFKYTHTQNTLPLAPDILSFANFSVNDIGSLTEIK